MKSCSEGFRVRSFVAVGLTVTGLGLPLTGVVNHFYGFSGLTVLRHAWMTAHNMLGLLFVGFAVWHSLINRRPLFGHFRGVAVNTFRFGRETVWACSVVLILLLLAIAHAFHGSAGI